MTKIGEYDGQLLDAIASLFGVDDWWAGVDVSSAGLDNMVAATTVARMALAEALADLREASERYRAEIGEDDDAGERHGQRVVVARAKYRAGLGAARDRLRSCNGSGR